MSTNAGTPPPAEQPAFNEAPAAPAETGLPRDPQGRFASPGELPPPAVGGIDPNVATQFYDGFSNPATRDQAVARVLESYGYVPQGWTADQVRQAAQLFSQIPEGVDPNYLVEIAREEAAMAANPWAAQQQPYGQQPPQPGMPPQQQPGFGQPDPAQVQEYMQRLAQEAAQQQFNEFRAEQQRQAFVGSLESSVGSTLAAAGLPETAAEIVRNQAYALANSYLSAGGQMDPTQAANFVQQAAQQIRALAPVAGAQQVAAQQQVNPQTVTPPAGGAQAGIQPAAGIAGAGQRAAAALEALRASGEI